MNDLPHKAAAIIKENGHTRKRYLHKSGRCCVLGSLYLAAADLTPQKALDLYGVEITDNARFLSVIKRTKAYEKNEMEFRLVCHDIYDRVHQRPDAWNAYATQERVIEVLHEVRPGTAAEAANYKELSTL